MGLREGDPAGDRREGEPDYAGPEFALFFAGFGLGLTSGSVRRAEDEGTGEGLPLSAGDRSVYSLNESLALKSGYFLAAVRGRVFEDPEGPTRCRASCAKTAFGLP